MYSTMTYSIPMTAVVFVFTTLHLVASETSTVHPGDVCNGMTCKNGSRCLTDGSGTFECACAIGYNGTNCDEDIDECLTRCQLSNARCKNTPGSYACTCEVGFTGADPEQSGCQDVNECPTKCYQLNTVCRNFPGSFRCDCINGYEGDSPESKPCVAINKDETGPISILVFCGIAGVLLVILIAGMICFFCWKKDKPARSDSRIKVLATPSFDRQELKKVSYVEERRSSLYVEAPVEVPVKNLTAVRPSTKRRYTDSTEEQERATHHEAHTAHDVDGDGERGGDCASNTMCTSSESGETQTSQGSQTVDADSPVVLGNVILSVDTLTSTADNLFPAELGNSDFSVAVSRSSDLEDRDPESEEANGVGIANKAFNGKEASMFYI